MCAIYVWLYFLLPFTIQCFVPIPKVLLNNGLPIPVLGLGTLGSPIETMQAVKTAIDTGYRHIDCAYIYGNEKEIGQAISEKIADGVVKREDLFIVSKLWNRFHKPESVEGALNVTLKDLGLKYIDLYLMHFPLGLKEDDVTYSDDDYVDTWLAMEKLYKKGLAKSIGVSNFNKRQIERILKHGTVVPVTNQVECHPRLNQRKLIEFCKLKNITLTAYRPLGSIYDTPNNGPTLLQDLKIKQIAEKLNKSPAQILLRYQIQRGVIVIPKSSHKNRIIENSKIFDFVLSATDMDVINSLDVHGRIGVLDGWKEHKYYPFHDDY